jgi:two-component system, OmpR family, phosphate regulon sensor histidine kinase PhoR
MNKKWLYTTLVLMSISLIGIILVQGYWIKISFESRSEEFSTAILDVLEHATEQIEEREIKDYYQKLAVLIDSVGTPKSTHIRNFFFVNREISEDEIIYYSHNILEEGYDLSTNSLPGFWGATSSDTTRILNFTSKRTQKVFRSTPSFDSNSTQIEPVEVIEKIGGLSSIEKAQYEDVFMEAAKATPIYERLSAQELQFVLSRELLKREITLPFAFGIVRQGYPTSVKSNDFDFTVNSNFKVPIFRDSEGVSAYQLVLDIPKKDAYLVRDVLGLMALSVFFTLIILAAFSVAIYQLFAQKKLAEIKADFINNMTHEFKTPIATIGLAVDALRSVAKKEQSTETVVRYLNMIRDENKRMHTQVENVLQIAQLERQQIELDRKETSLHEVILQAKDRMDLIASERNGTIVVELEADNDKVWGDSMHLTHVFINLLDNAIKYTDEQTSPLVRISTVVSGRNIVVKLSDNGIGMSRTTLKQAFEKFYRETSGNLHLVKGHGLGLAYVKQIIEAHQGKITAESEKGVGTTFYVQLKLY